MKLQDNIKLDHLECTLKNARNFGFSKYSLSIVLSRDIIRSFYQKKMLIRTKTLKQ